MAELGEWHCEERPFAKNESFASLTENVPETGCLSIIVLGASGDLAKKKTFPALFNLYRQVNQKYCSAFDVVNYLLLELNKTFQQKH